MVAVVIVLAVVAVALAALAVVTRQRLGAQRALASSAEARAEQQATELASLTSARDDAEQRAAGAEAARDDIALRATEAEKRAAAAEREAAGAFERANSAESERDRARHETEDAQAAQVAAEERLVEFELRTAAAQAAQQAAAEAAAKAAGTTPDVTGELDVQVLWALEKARSERTWRQSVAVDPTGSAFGESSEPLAEALQIEVDAAREEVGAVADLEVDLPPEITAAGAIMTLRAGQELLADVVRRAETTVLRVRGDGRDLVVEVDARDEDGRPVEVGPLPAPDSRLVERTPAGVRIRNAVTPGAGGT